MITATNAKTTWKQQQQQPKKDNCKTEKEIKNNNRKHVDAMAAISEKNKQLDQEAKRTVNAHQKEEGPTNVLIKS